MDRLIIRGGNPLVGIVHVSGGKKRRAAAKITAGWESLSPPQVPRQQLGSEALRGLKKILSANRLKHAAPGFF